MKPDFGSPKKRKKSDAGGDKLSVKVKGRPAEVNKVLGKMAGAGDLTGMSQKQPGVRGPRRPYHGPPKSSERTAPPLARPLGQEGGKRPRLTAQSTGVGDAPLPLRGGAQPVLSLTKLTVLKRPNSAKNPPSNNPENPRSGPMPGKRKVGK